jgi:hypothetical protein
MWKGLIKMGFVSVFGVLVFKILITELSDISTDPNLSSAESALLNLLPIVFVVTIIACMTAAFFGYETYVRYKRWGDFGNRMKAAYTAKFGGENKGFNDEVDKRIAVMKSLSFKEGMTKETTEDWLKRMAVFVEIPYVIPEEEKLSEEEKTRQFADDYVVEEEEEEEEGE